MHRALAHDAGTHCRGLRHWPQASCGEEALFRPRGRAGLVPGQVIDHVRNEPPAPLNRQDTPCNETLVVGRWREDISHTVTVTLL